MFYVALRSPPAVANNLGPQAPLHSLLLHWRTACMRPPLVALPEQDRSCLRGRC